MPCYPYLFDAVPLAAKFIPGRSGFVSFRRALRATIGWRLFPVFPVNAIVLLRQLPRLDSIRALLMRLLNGPVFTDRF